MNNKLCRRTFLKASLLSAGTILAYSLSIQNLFAKAKAKVKKTLKFSINKSKGGCNRCENAINGILNNKLKKDKLEKMFANRENVTFFVRRQKRRKLPKCVKISVGNCARSLRSKSDLYIKGCTKEITTKYVFQEIENHFGDKNGRGWGFR